jgi:site-specific DNA recombinase
MIVVAYARYSSEAQRDGYSIEAQVRAITEWVEHEGHTLLRVYVDEARSGTTDNRERFQDMIADASKGEFQAVVVHKLDRFARNRYDSAVYRHALKQHGIRVISVLEPLDDSPESSMMEAVLEGMAEYYSRNLSREVRKGKKEAALLKRFVGGRVPFGYSVTKDHEYVINEEEALVIRQIFSMLDNGSTNADVARWVNAHGYRTREGLYFSALSISRLISNTILIGRYTYAKRSRTGQEPIIIEDALPPIIDSATFWRVNEMKKARERGPRPRKKEEDYLLTGYLFCELCGHHIYGFKSRSYFTAKDGIRHVYERNCYRCSTKGGVHHGRRLDPDYVSSPCKLKLLPKEELESFVLSAIDGILFGGLTADWIVAELTVRKKNEKSPDASLLASYKKELSKIKTQKERLLDLYLSGGIDKAVYSARAGEFSSREQFLTSEVSRLSVPTTANVDASKIKTALDAFRKSANADSPEYKRRLLSAFVNKITVSNERLVIYFKFPIPGAGDKVEKSYDDYFVRKPTNDPTIVYLRTEFSMIAFRAGNWHDYSVSLV